MIAGYFLCSFIGMIINVRTIKFACGWFWMLGMSVYDHEIKTFLLLFTTLVVYKLQHNIDRSASNRCRLHISSKG